MQGEPDPDPKFNSISMQWPTSQELAAAARIRSSHKQTIERLKDPARDVVGDLRIVRFLRARHHKEEEAKEWYGEFLKARLETSEIEEKFRPAVIGMSPEEFAAFFEERVHPSMPLAPWLGWAKTSVGVMIVRSGMIDAVQLTEERADIPLAQDKLLIVAMLEWLLWYLDEESHRQQKMLFVVKVIDMSGLGADGRKLPVFVPKMKTFMSNLIEVMQKPYCEHDAVFIILNAPFMFRVVYNVIYYLLTKKQRSKMKILGNVSEAKVREELLGIVDASILPTELGGQQGHIKNVYPIRGADTIKDWISRVRTLDFWPPRPAVEKVASGGEKEPSAKSYSPAPEVAETVPSQAAVDIAVEAPVEKYAEQDTALPAPISAPAEEKELEVKIEETETAKSCGCWSS